MNESPPSPHSIVAGHGWIEEKRSYQPKTACFRVLCLLWVFPSLGAVFVLAVGCPDWFGAPDWLESLRAVRFEEWIALGLLLAHPLFGVLAWRYGATEPLKEACVRIPNPES